MTGQSHRTEHFTIEGDVAHVTFPVWIERHARKLGLTCGPVQPSRTRLEFRAEGAPDMLDAMETGCSLGPISAQVQRIHRERLSD